MNKGTSPFATDADVQRAGVTALPDEQTDDPMQRISSKAKRANHGSDAVNTIRVTESDMMSLITEDVDRVYAKHSPVSLENPNRANPCRHDEAWH